jgi:ketosteroid isomerase-like protein
MERILISLTLTAALNLSNCTRQESNAEITPEVTQAISALRSAYAAFNRGDIEAAVEPFDAQIEWTEPVEFGGGGTYRGRDGVKRYLAQSRAPWAEGSSEPERFIASGKRIVVFVHARFRLKGSNKCEDVSLADVYTIRNGKAIQMRAFADRQEALRWVGLENRPSRGKEVAS